VHSVGSYCTDVPKVMVAFWNLMSCDVVQIWRSSLRKGWKGLVFEDECEGDFKSKFRAVV